MSLWFFSLISVLLSAKAGATYISPFVGRLDDAGEDWMEMIAESLEIIKNFGFDFTNYCRFRSPSRTPLNARQSSAPWPRCRLKL